MATIKAGTYRFNDVLDVILPNDVKTFFDFTVTTNVPELGVYTFTCDYIAVGDDVFVTDGIYGLYYRVKSISPDPPEEVADDMKNGKTIYTQTHGWYTDYYGEGIQYITIPADSEVSDDFYTWFTENAVEQKQISGVWKLNDTLTAIPYEICQVSMGMWRQDFVRDHGFNITPIELSEDGMTLSIVRVSPLNTFGDMFVDGNPTVFSEEVVVQLDRELVPGVSCLGLSVEKVVGFTVDLGDTPQYVSALAYNWLTENATQPSASIHYNGSTIASLFGGETATLKCAGMQMETDVVVEVSEQQECDKPHVIEVTGLPATGVDGATYKVSERTLTDLVMFDGEQVVSFGGYLSAGVIPGSMNIIPTKTSDGVLVSTADCMHTYFVEDENDVFVYGDFAGTGTNEWILFASVLGYAGAPYNGEISSISEATSIGYYTIFGTKPYYAEHNKRFTSMLYMDGLWLSFGTYMSLTGMYGSYTDVGILPTKTTENIQVTDVDADITYGYYIADEDNIFIYGDFMGTGTNDWLPIANMISLTYCGVVSGPSECTEEGIYALITDWDEYIRPSGIQQIVEDGIYDVTDKATVRVHVDIPDGYYYVSGEQRITENGVHDVTYYETVNVSVASNYMVQTVAELPTDVPDGAFAIVLGGA